MHGGGLGVIGMKEIGLLTFEWFFSCEMVPTTLPLLLELYIIISTPPHSIFGMDISKKPRYTINIMLVCTVIKFTVYIAAYLHTNIGSINTHFSHS